jgi:type IV secretion system protein VirB4
MLDKETDAMAVYAEYIPRKRTPDLVSDEVPWRTMLLPGLILQKAQHGLQRSYAVRGPDLQGISPEEQGALMLQANEVLKRIGGQWMLQSEAQRTKVTHLPPIAWNYVVPQLIDEERRATLLGTPGSRETTYTMTLSWIPPALTTQKGLRFLMTGPGPPTTRPGGHDTQQVSLQEFLARTDFFMDLLRGMLTQCRAMGEVETLTYLHNCVSDRWYPVGPLASWLDIDHQLCDTPLSPAGWYPQLGRWHLRTCSILGYPAQSLAGMMRAMDALGLEYRWCTRWLGMEKYVQEGILKGAQRAWIGEETSFMDRTVEHVTKHDTRVRNTTATLHAEHIDAARQEIGMDVLAYGEFTGTVTVWDDDPDLADAKRRRVMEALANQGFTAHAEAWHHTAAWLSSLPGDRLHNVHKSTHHTLTLAHLMPGVAAMWPGPDHDAYLQGGPWFYAQTEFTNLFRVVNHQRDLGQFLVLGPTRSGKSTFGNFLRAMWMQYLHAQATVFDVDGHARLLTYLLGGSWYDLGSPGLRLQPLRHCDDPLRQGLLLQWLLDILELHHVTVNAYSQMFVRGALQKLALRPPAQRTWDEFLRILAEKPPGSLHEVHNHRVRVDAQGIGHEDVHLRALDQLKAEVRWTFQRYSELFGSADDPLSAHPVQTFELRALLTQSHLLGPIMRYVMLEVSLQMSTRAPMFLLLDDAAIAWLMPKTDSQRATVVAPGRQTMEQQCLDWLQTTAKKAVSLGVATHSLEKVFESPIGRILVEGCHLRFFMPNASAMTPLIHRVYTEVGLSDVAIQTMATARLQRDVYVTYEELGQRLIALPHGPLTLDCLARNSAEDHALMDALIEKEGREGFAEAWLRHHGHAEAAAVCAARNSTGHERETHEATVSAEN